MDSTPHSHAPLPAAPTQPLPPVAPTPPAASPPAVSPPVHFERRSRHMGWRSSDVLRATAIVIGVLLALRLLWFAHPLVLVSFLGVLFGLAVTAGVDRLQRWRVPRGVGAPLIVFGFIGLLVAFGAWAAPTLRAQSAELRTKLPEAADKFDAWLEAHRSGLIGLLLENLGASDRGRGGSAGQGTPVGVGGAGAPGGTAVAAPPASGGAAARTPAAVPGAGPAARVESEDARGDTASPAGETRSAGSQLRQRLLAQFSGAKRYLFPVVSSTFAAIGGLLLVMFLTIYTAVDPDLYHRGLMGLFPHGARARAGEVFSAIAATLRKWLLTQLIAMLAIGSVTTVVLLALNVKAAFPLGILAGLLEFIPTVGPILSAVPAIAMAFVDSPEKALTVALAYVGIQFLENHILIPLLMKGGVDLPPALTIVAQALMALVFGFLGLLVAVPLLAASVVAVKMLYVEDVVGDPVVVPGDDGEH